jgi:hypothetical protein
VGKIARAARALAATVGKIACAARALGMEGAAQSPTARPASSAHSSAAR